MKVNPTMKRQLRKRRPRETPDALILTNPFNNPLIENEHITNAPLFSLPNQPNPHNMPFLVPFAD